MNIRPLFIFLIFLFFGITYYLMNSETHESSNKKELTVKTPDKTEHIIENNNKSEIISSDLINVKQTTTENENISNYDLYYFALEILELAKNGDAEMQYKLAETLAYCESLMHPASKSQYDTNLMLELSDWWETRCAGFNNENIIMFGNIEEWINKSAEGGYVVAFVVKLSLTDNLITTEENLSKLHQAINTKNFEAINLVGSLSKNNETSDTWKALACDYGYNCRGTSKELWRSDVAAYCSLLSFTGAPCNTNMTYFQYLKQRHSANVYDKIMNRKQELKEIIESGNIAELTWEKILD